MSVVDDVRAGVISPEVGVAQLMWSGLDAAGMLALLDEVGAGDGAAVEAMRALVRARPGAIDALAAEVTATAAEHTAEGGSVAEGVARIAAFFDRAVAHSPEASVALYSLGDPAILAAATAEIVAWLGREGLLRAGMDVLDLGCGIGRVAGALAPHCRSVLGVDVSAGMVAEAGRRLAGVANVMVRTTGGEDLDWLEAGGFDLVLAIDSFPYIVQAGVAARHVAGAARALRAGGALCVLNLSYRQDLGADRADLAGWAGAAGLRVVVDGTRPFGLWDGDAFVLRG